MSFHSHSGSQEKPVVTLVDDSTLETAFRNDSTPSSKFIDVIYLSVVLREMNKIQRCFSFLWM